MACVVVNLCFNLKILKSSRINKIRIIILPPAFGFSTPPAKAPVDTSLVQCDINNNFSAKSESFLVLYTKGRGERLEVTRCTRLKEAQRYIKLCGVMGQSITLPLPACVILKKGRDGKEESRIQICYTLTALSPIKKDILNLLKFME